MAYSGSGHKCPGTVAGGQFDLGLPLWNRGGKAGRWAAKRVWLPGLGGQKLPEEAWAGRWRCPRREAGRCLPHWEACHSSSFLPGPSRPCHRSSRTSPSPRLGSPNWIRALSVGCTSAVDQLGPQGPSEALTAMVQQEVPRCLRWQRGKHVAVFPRCRAGWGPWPVSLTVENLLGKQEHCAQALGLSPGMQGCRPQTMASRMSRALN